jgi:hypothetical protein
MIHTLKSISNIFKLDEQKLTEFALNNPIKYGIISESDKYTTSTWFTNNLVKDFKKNELLKSLINYINSSLELHNKLYPEAQLTYDDVINHLKQNVKK